MAARQWKQKSALWAATLFIVIVLSVVWYVTLSGMFKADVPDPAFDEVDDVDNEPSWIVQFDTDTDYSDHSMTIGAIQEIDVLHVSNEKFCAVMRNNMHFVTTVLTRGALKDMCSPLLQLGSKQFAALDVTTTGYTSTSDVTLVKDHATRAEAAVTEVTKRQNLSDMNKLRELCRNPSRIRNRSVRKILPDICSTMYEADRKLPAEAFGTVATAHVTTEPDSMTKQQADVTTKADQFYSALPVATSVGPEPDVTHNISDMELATVVCQNLHLTAPSFRLNLMCNVVRHAGYKTAATTNVTSNMTPQDDLLVQKSRIMKLSEVCSHLDELKDRRLVSVISDICTNLENPGSTPLSDMLMTIPPRDQSINKPVEESIEESDDKSTAESVTPTHQHMKEPSTESKDEYTEEYYDKSIDSAQLLL